MIRVKPTRPALEETLSSWPPRQDDLPASGLYSLRLSLPLPHLRRIGKLPSPHVVWARPDRGHYRIGVGEAWRIEIPGGCDRFARLDQTITNLNAHWTCESLTATASPPGLFCACAFDDEAVMDGAWNKTPANLLLLPEVLLELHGNAGTLTLSCAAAALTDLDACRRRWIAQASALLDAYLAPAASEEEGVPLNRSRAIPSDSDWLELAREARDIINEGHFEKLVLARQVSYRSETGFDTAAVLNELFDQFPECRILCFREHDKTILSATPERLISLHQGRVNCDALGGTGPRDGERQGALRETHGALTNDPKTLHEHQLVVEHLRKVLKASTRYLEIPDAPRIMALGGLEHLWTPVTGNCEKEIRLLELVAQLHPTPAVAGAPRAASREWLRRREPFSRGWYGGPIGWLDATGDGDLAVLLRCAVLSGKEARLYAGAGIVAASDPRAELKETELKLQAMFGVLNGSTAR